MKRKCIKWDLGLLNFSAVNNKRQNISYRRKRRNEATFEETMRIFQN